MATALILNDERFTHLLDLRQILISQSVKDCKSFCKNHLFSSLNNDNKLLAEILFYGMHKLLFKIDINIINNMKQNLLKQNKSRISTKITHNRSTSEWSEQSPSPSPPAILLKNKNVSTNKTK